MHMYSINQDKAGMVILILDKADSKASKIDTKDFMC